MIGSVDIENNIHEYLYGDGNILGVKPFERYTSFDYCFNYFQSFKERGIVKELADNKFVQTSCFQLAFYLASWGMYRGSTFLFRKSAKYLEPIIIEVANSNPSLWDIDANLYTVENIEELLEFKRILIDAFRPNWPSDTLVSKIILGVFGNVPAFDSYFKKGFGVSTFGLKSLQKISDFYDEHKKIIDRYRMRTLEFESGDYTNRRYTRAKVIDMIFYIEGGKE